MKRWILIFILLPFLYGAQSLSEREFRKLDASCNQLLGEEKYSRLIKQLPKL